MAAHTEHLLSVRASTPHLHYRCVDLQYLFLAFDLSDADLAGQMR